MSSGKGVPDPAELLIRGSFAVLEAITNQASEGGLPQEAIPTLGEGETSSSITLDVKFEPDWHRIVDAAFVRAEADPRVAPAVACIYDRLPDELRDSTPLPLSGAPSAPAARVFCGFCELLIAEYELDLPSPERMKEAAFDALEMAVGELDSFCASRSHRVVFTAPLEAVSLGADSPVECDENTSIVPIDESDRQRIWSMIGFDPARAIQGWAAPSPMAVWDCEAAVEVSFDYALGISNTNWAPAQRTINQVVDSLRLLCSGNVHPLAEWPEIPRHRVFLKRFMLIGVSRPAPRTPVVPEPSNGSIDPASLRTTLANLRASREWTGKKKHALDLAMRRFAQTYSRSSSEDRLIDYWVAFETLFLPGSGPELRYRAQMRIARFVGDTLDERERIREQLNDSYSLRSSIVHGSMTKKQTPAAVREVAAQTADTLRRALRRWIDPGFDGSAKALDRDLLS